MDPYTIVLQLGAWWNPSEAAVVDILRQRLGDIADIVRVERKLLSSNYTITFFPKISMTNDQWISAFIASLQDAGYESTDAVSISGGWVDKPGPLGEISSLIKWGVVGIMAYVLIQVLQVGKTLIPKRRL